MHNTTVQLVPKITQKSHKLILNLFNESYFFNIQIDIGLGKCHLCSQRMGIKVDIFTTLNLKICLLGKIEKNTMFLSTYHTAQRPNFYCLISACTEKAVLVVKHSERTHTVCVAAETQ